MKHYTESPLPAFRISLVISALFLGLVIILPMTVILYNVTLVDPSEFFSIITDDRTVAAYSVTLKAAGAAAIFTTFFGLAIAWVLSAYDFKGHSLIDALIDIPFALPTSVVGLTIAILYDQEGFMGRLLGGIGLSPAFHWTGIAIAMAFTSLPFGVRIVQPSLEKIEEDQLEAAMTLGASPFKIFYSIILARISPALFSGFILSFSRSLGEFGAILFISGNIPFETEVISLLINGYLDESDDAAAMSVTFVVLVTSILLLILGLYLALKSTHYLKTTKKVKGFVIAKEKIA